MQEEVSAVISTNVSILILKYDIFWIKNAYSYVCLLRDIMPVTKCKPVILTTAVLTYGNQFMLVIYAKCIYRGK